MPEWKYEKTFEKLFCRNKVLSSSEITGGIRSEHPECNETNARNVIRTARQKSVIDRIQDIVIGHNEYLYYAPASGEKIYENGCTRLLIQRYKTCYSDREL